MSNPIFPNIEQILNIILGELPANVFASDRADNTDISKRSYSSSELRAHAQIYGNLYLNLLDIYLNKFITTVQPDQISNWESDLFQNPVDSSLSFEQRVLNLLTKYRMTGGISYSYIYNLVSSILTPKGLPFIINVYGGLPQGAWMLDYSPLDTNTYLSDISPLAGNIIGQYDLDCYATMNIIGTTNSSNTITGLISEVIPNIHVGAGITGYGIPANTTVLSVGVNTLVMSNVATSSTSNEMIQIQNYIVAGLTLEQFQEIQTVAYTYEVDIYGTADALTLSSLNQTLTQSEPAGSTHVIKNNVNDPMDPNIIDLGGGVGCVLIDAIDCGNFYEGSTWNVWDFNL